MGCEDTNLKAENYRTRYLLGEEFCRYICFKIKLLSLFLYNIFIILYKLGIRVAAFRSPKAKLWLIGREDLISKLESWRAQLNEDEKIIWVHCASLGEFEQGRPIIEAIKNDFSSYKILLTFFSPSGYEIRKEYKLADGVFYLPMDGKMAANKFIDIVRPTAVIWVKYEYWYYFLTTLKQRGIPVFLVSAIFRKSQPFFRWYSGLWKEMLYSFSQIFVQNETSEKLLAHIGIASNTILAGDTRFDRVISIAKSNEQLNESIINFCANYKVLVAGSTWLEDEEILVHYAKVHPHIKFIIAPHEIDEERMQEVKKVFNGAILFSEIRERDLSKQILIIDNIGMLSQLYKNADIAYIGGGFNDTGIHNILEAAVYGKPVVFGPEYENFSEAIALVDKGGAFSVENALELEALLDKLFGDEKYKENASQISKDYVTSMQGATNKIIKHLYEKRLLTN